MWSRSMSVFASILWVICRVNSEKPDRTVERAGGQPVHSMATGQQPAVRAAPEPHMVPLRRVALHLLLVRHILLVPEQEQRADRRLVVAPPQHGRPDDAPAGPQRHVVGARPPRLPHGVVELRLGAEQREIDRVAEQAVAGAGPADEVVRNVDLGQDAVQPREHEVRQHDPEQHEEQDEEPAPLEALREHEPGQPDGGDPAEDEEEVVHHRARGGAAARRRAALRHLLRLPRAGHGAILGRAGRPP